MLLLSCVLMQTDPQVTHNVMTGPKIPSAGIFGEEVYTQYTCTDFVTTAQTVNSLPATKKCTIYYPSNGMEVPLATNRV